jgi:glycosyltransferase involved in cell wall biosynthesis
VASQPILSVLTATFDGAAFVAETIESVLAQTYERVEHVIVDDGSTDETVEIVERYREQYPARIVLLENTERAGPCRRRNDALAAARGTYLAWLDQDDLWSPTKLARQLDALERKPTAGFAYTQYEVFDDATGAIVDRSSHVDEDDLLSALFTRGCFIASSTVVIRRPALERRGLAFRDRDFSFGDDYFLWLALSLDGPGVLVDEPLVRIRRHARNESARLALTNFNGRSADLLEEFIRTFPDASRKLGRSRRRGIAFQLAVAAAYELEHGRRREAARYATRAAAHDPAGAARYALNRARGAPRAVRRRLGSRADSPGSSA